MDEGVEACCASQSRLLFFLTMSRGAYSLYKCWVYYCEDTIGVCGWGVGRHIFLVLIAIDVRSFPRVWQLVWGDGNRFQFKGKWQVLLFDINGIMFWDW